MKFELGYEGTSESRDERRILAGWGTRILAEVGPCPSLGVDKLVYFVDTKLQLPKLLPIVDDIRSREGEFFATLKMSFNPRMSMVPSSQHQSRSKKKEEDSDAFMRLVMYHLYFFRCMY